MSDDEKMVPGAAFQEMRAREAERRGISVAELDAHLEKLGRTMYQEAITREAERRGMTRDEFIAHIGKEAECEVQMVEFMRAGGVNVRGRYQALLAAHTGQTVAAKKSEGGKTTAEKRKMERSTAADVAARIWDSLNAMPELNRASVIAQRMGKSEAAVRGYLRATGRKTKRR